jgi:GNAT superfamily N-acetyltransferase
MNRPQATTTRFPTDADLAPDNVERLTRLINDVYDDAESGMWKRKGTRTTSAEVARLLRARTLILAELDGELVGSVNVKLLGEGLGEFGMLVASPKSRGRGAGSALIEHAERWAREQGCHTMRLKVLSPRHWVHPGKEFLRQWYAKIGYTSRDTEPFEIMHPERVPELATECDYTVWYKPLSGSL